MPAAPRFVFRPKRGGPTPAYDVYLASDRRFLGCVVRHDAGFGEPKLWNAYLTHDRDEEPVDHWRMTRQQAAEDLLRVRSRA